MALSYNCSYTHHDDNKLIYQVEKLNYLEKQ